jgi:hypothetical protein
MSRVGGKVTLDPEEDSYDDDGHWFV